MRYVAVIDKDPDSAYGIQLPEVRGCISVADTFEEMVPNAIEALKLFFEDGEPVAPVLPRSGARAGCRNIAEGAPS